MIWRNKNTLFTEIRAVAPGWLDTPDSEDKPAAIVIPNPPFKIIVIPFSALSKTQPPNLHGHRIACPEAARICRDEIRLTHEKVMRAYVVLTSDEEVLEYGKKNLDYLDSAHAIQPNEGLTMVPVEIFIPVTPDLQGAPHMRNPSRFH